MKLLFTAQQWLHNAELQMYGVTQSDIDNAHAGGFIKYYAGVGLYLWTYLQDATMGEGKE